METASLWLVPGQSAHDELSRTIAALAARLGTPAFTPHVTLVGGVTGAADELSCGAREVARRSAPISVRLASVRFGDEYFRCCVLVAEGTGLLAARRVAEAVFPVGPAAYVPHLSLVYGSLPQTVRERLRPEIEAMLPIVFEARRLEVWKTAGEVSSWRRLASFRMP